jgi:CBS domain-containing protein
MKLLKLARVPPVVVSPQESVKAAVNKMCEVGVGAVAVVKDGDLVGIFTERDLMTRVVKPGLSSLDTPVAEVMTRKPHVAPREKRIFVICRSRISTANWPACSQFATSCAPLWRTWHMSWRA